MLSHLSSTFEPEQADLYLDGKITLTFNVNIDPLSIVANQTVQVYALPANQKIAINVAVESFNIVISPSLAFPVNTSLAVVITAGSSGVKGIDGEELSSNVIVELTTGSKINPANFSDPEVTLAESESGAADIDFVTNAINPGGSVKIVVPDTSPQGEIKEWKPCPPFEGIESTTEIILVGSGIPSVMQSELSLVGAFPSGFDVGVLNVSEMIVIWNEAVLSSDSQPIELLWQDLPVPIDPFSSNAISPTGNIVLINSSGTQQFDLPDGFVTENKEFTMLIKAGKFSSVDLSKLNRTQRIVFSGPLSPILCSIDHAKTNAGMWHVELSPKDIYFYYKMIHDMSTIALARAGYSSVSEVPSDELIALRKYVCCSTALRMLAFGNEDASAASGSGGNWNVYVKKRTFPGVSIDFGLFNSGAAGSSKDSTTPQSEVVNRLVDCIKQNAPAGEEMDPSIGPFAIKHGLRSRMDRSRPIKRRLS